MVRFAAPTGTKESLAGDLIFLVALIDAAEFVLVNIARGALEGSSAASLEIVPLGGLYIASGSLGISAVAPAVCPLASGGFWGSDDVGGIIGCVRVRAS